MAFDCLRNPPELCSRVARNSLSSRALTRAPASSLWTMATTSFTRGVSTPRATGGQRGSAVSAGHAGVYDAASDDPDACRSPLCRPTTSPAIPAPPSPVPSRRSPDAATSTPSSTASSRRRATALRPVMGAIFISDPDRPGLQLVAAHGMDDAVDRAAGGRSRRSGPSVQRRRDMPGPRRSTARRRCRTGRPSSAPTCRSSSRVAASTSRSGRSASAGRRHGSSMTPNARR